MKVRHEVRAEVRAEARRIFVAKFGERGADVTIAGFDARPALATWERTRESSAALRREIGHIREALVRVAETRKKFNKYPPSFVRAELDYVFRETWGAFIRATRHPHGVQVGAGTPSEIQVEEPTRTTWLRDYARGLALGAGVRLVRDIEVGVLASCTLLAGFATERHREITTAAVFKAERKAVLDALDALDDLNSRPLYML